MGGFLYLYIFLFPLQGMAALREAVYADLNDLHSLNMRLVSQNYRFSKLKKPKAIEHVYYNYYKKRLQDKNSIFFVAEEKGKIIGFILGEIERRAIVYRHEKGGYVSDLFVLENYRRKGIGKHLANRLLSWLALKKIRRIRLHVDANNLNAIAFWRKSGFSKHKIEMEMAL